MRASGSSNSVLVDLIELNVDGVIIVDDQGIVRFANPAAQKLFGVNVVGELFGFPLVGEQVQIRLHAPGSEPRDVELRVRSVNWQGGRATLASLRDVTDRARAEQELRDSELRYRLLAENVTDIISRHDAEGHFTYASPSATGLLKPGMDENGLIGRSLLALVHPEDQRAVSALFLTHLAASDEEAASSEAQATHTVVYRADPELSGDEDPRWLETTIRLLDPAIDPAGGFVAVTRDISERKSLEAQLHQAQKMEALGQLAGGVAHDFNNLLTVITGYTEAMLRRLGRLANSPDAEQESPALLRELVNDLRGEADEVHRAAESAHAVTRQLLTFSRKHVIRPEPLDLNQMIRGMAPMLRSLLGERCRLELNLAEDLPRVDGESHRLQQVIINLAVNALDAMPGGGDVTISTELMPAPSGETTSDGASDDTSGVSDTLGGAANQQVCLCVADTGAGMTPDVAARVFEPFFTTKATDRGTGLGLSTTFAIVQQHRGTISVESAPGEGARFAITLPAIDEAASVASPMNESADEPVEDRPRCVLVVEDQDRIRRLVTRILGSEGFEVIEADGAETAIQQLESRGDGVDLLLTDVVMPGLSGPELAEKVHQRIPGLRVLFMSGYTNGYLSDAGDEVRTTVPAERFLQKPFSVDQLLGRIHDVLSDPRPSVGVNAAE